MESHQPATSRSSSPTQDQEDWNTFFDLSNTGQAEFPVYDPGMMLLGGTPGAAPDYTGYVAGMHDPPTSFEDNAPGPLSPDGTLWLPNNTIGYDLPTPVSFDHMDIPFTVPGNFCEKESISLVNTLPEPSTAANDGDEAAPNVTQCYTMAPVQLTGTSYDGGQGGVQFETGYEAIQSSSSSSPDKLHCGMHGCQMTFPYYNLLDRHQRFHTRHHWVASESPFICECGQKCAKLDTLQRHIKKFQDSSSEFRCQQCEFPRVFKRKDHLVQHLRHRHKFGDAELQAEFPVRKVIMNNKPVCHFIQCPYYRDAGFRDQPLDFQEENRPFVKKADYTKHMRDVHDWSPFPCTFSSCDKRDKKGYFSQKALQTHRQDQHPEVEEDEPLGLELRRVQRVPCGVGCGNKYHPASLSLHRWLCRQRLERSQASQLEV